MSGPSQKKILLGYISGLMGVKGWIKVHSYTHPRENITEFKHWILILGDVEHVMDVESGRKQGRTIVAKFCGINDPDEISQIVSRESITGLISRDLKLEQKKMNCLAMLIA
jgi:16S rRNA processing protein RimM